MTVMKANNEYGNGDDGTCDGDGDGYVMVMVVVYPPLMIVMKAMALAPCNIFN